MLRKDAPEQGARIAERPDYLCGRRRVVWVGQLVQKREEFAGVGTLGDHVIEPSGLRNQKLARLVRVVSGERDQYRLGTWFMRANSARQIVARQSGHLDVEHAHFGVVSNDTFERTARIGARAYVVPLVAQDRRERHNRINVVVAQKDVETTLRRGTLFSRLHE